MCARCVCLRARRAEAIQALIRMERTYGIAGTEQSGGILQSGYTKLLKVLLQCGQLSSDPAVATQWVFEMIHLQIHAGRAVPQWYTMNVLGGATAVEKPTVYFPPPSPPSAFPPPGGGAGQHRLGVVLACWPSTGAALARRGGGGHARSSARADPRCCQVTRGSTMWA